MKPKQSLMKETSARTIETNARTNDTNGRTNETIDRTNDVQVHVVRQHMVQAWQIWAFSEGVG